MSAPVTWVATFDEAEDVARLLAAFRDHLGGGGVSDNAVLAGVERLLEDPATEFLLGAPDPDSPPAGVAQVRFRFSVWTGAPDCWLEDLFVREDARGAGLGRALVEAVLGRARERGCRRVELDVDEANDPALALYRAAGFAAKGAPASRALYLQRRLEA